MSETSHTPFSTDIEARRLTKYFGNRPALRGIDLAAGVGERLVIFGPNGAGKTTLLKILATLMKPSSGSVMLGGNDIRAAQPDARRKLALVTHQTFLYDDLTAYENLKFFARMYDVPAPEERIGEVISWAQLESRRNDKVATLSRGMQQRLSIARAVLHNPSVLLLDEPETGLDPEAGAMISGISRDSGNENRTVIMTSHNLERGLSLADRVIILDRGAVVYQSLVKDIESAEFPRIYGSHTGTEK